MISGYLYYNPRIVWLIIATILVAGISCLTVMPRLEDPILKRRVSVITVEMHGAGPVEIESSVTLPVENWLSEFPEIRQVRSSTRTSIASFVVELGDQVDDPEKVWASINARLLKNAGQLPEGCSDPVLHTFPLKAYASIVAIVPADARATSPFQHRRLARELRKRILNLDATEAVDVFGDGGEEITVRVTPTMLATLGSTIGDIAEQIGKSKALPAGDSEQDGTLFLINLKEPSRVVKQIEDAFIHTQGTTKPVRLFEIANVVRSTPAPPSSAALIGGKESIVLGAMVDDDARVDRWASRLDEVVADFSSVIGDDYSVISLFDQSEHINQRMTELLINMAISSVAVATVVLFMMGWRCMIIVVVSLPLSSCLVICGLRALSVPIHQMSVTGLVVALGLLIDNSIVIVEEVRSRIFAGNRPLRAIQDAVRHLCIPLLGSTLTTILAFLPIATMPGPAGEFVGSLAISVILAIAASFVMAMTVIPPMVSALGVSENRRGLLEYGLRFRSLTESYRRTLQSTFRWPVLGIGVGLVLPISGFLVSQQLDREFFPASDRRQIQIELELPATGTLDAVKEVSQRVSRLVDQDVRVRQQSWFLGQSAPTFFYNVVPRRQNSPYYAQAFVDVESDASLDRLVNELQTQLDSHVRDARVVVRKLEQGPPFNAPVEVRLVGDDLRVLQSLGEQVRVLLSESDLVTHTRSDLGSGNPKLTFDLDPGVLRDTRLTPREISGFLYQSLEGASAGSFFDDGEQIPVHVRVDFEDQPVVEVLPAMTVARPDSRIAGQFPSSNREPGFPPQTDAPLLGNLGEFKLGSDVGTIIRIDGKRINEVMAYLKAGALPSVVIDEFRAALGQSDMVMPEGYQIEFGGESEKRNQAVTTLIANAIVLFCIMVVTLVLTLGSLRSAFIIASVGGLTIGLAPLALYCFGHPFGFMAIVGTMGLVGVAINDSIVVLAAIRANDQLRKQGEISVAPEQLESPTESERAAIEDVVVDCTRHILTTTFTTMIGFLPLVILGGMFWPPLAIVIAAGVFGATLFALYFVPSVYLMLNRNRRES